ncbi:DUF4249 domain-containing protein [Chitinophagaceae bacterium MMS25-I14]
MKTIFHIAIVAIISISFTACTKVIHVDLNSSDPKLVVEGSVNDQPGPYMIHLSRSVNFDEDNTQPPVTGAIVTIADNVAGIMDTLSENAPGYYYTHSISGVAGHTYLLTINDHGAVYSCQSTMPQPVALDSVYVTNFNAFGKTRKQVTPVFKDPVGIKNFYRFVEYVDGKKLDRIFVYSDKFTDGLINNRPIINRDTDVITGNNLKLEMQCIDENSYNYLNSLDQSALGESSTPGNPVNNISGGALGYFNAYTSNSRSIIVP